MIRWKHCGGAISKAVEVIIHAVVQKCNQVKLWLASAIISFSKRKMDHRFRLKIIGPEDLIVKINSFLMP